MASFRQVFLSRKSNCVHTGLFYLEPESQSQSGPSVLRNQNLFARLTKNVWKTEPLENPNNNWPPAQDEAQPGTGSQASLVPLQAVHVKKTYDVASAPRESEPPGAVYQNQAYSSYSGKS